MYLTFFLEIDRLPRLPSDLAEAGHKPLVLLPLLPTCAPGLAITLTDKQVLSLFLIPKGPLREIVPKPVPGTGKLRKLDRVARVAQSHALYRPGCS